MGNAAATGAGTGTQRAADYIALSTDTTAVAATDTTLTAELTGTGLARTTGTYSHTAGAPSYAITKAFTSGDATTRAIAKVAVFNAASAGIMVFSALLSSVATIASGDQLTITETITL